MIRQPTVKLTILITIKSSLKLVPKTPIVKLQEINENEAKIAGEIPYSFKDVLRILHADQR